MTPTEFQTLTARCDRMQREIDDLRALIGSPEALVMSVAPSVSLSDVLAASIEKENEIRGKFARAFVDEAEREILTTEVPNQTALLMTGVVECKVCRQPAMVGETLCPTHKEQWNEKTTIRETAIIDDRERIVDPDVSFLRGLADIIENEGEQNFQRHMPKRLNEIAAKIERTFRPATPKRATNVKGA